jgi:hypothetical protein
LIAGSAIIGSIGTFSLHVLLPALPAIALAMHVAPHGAAAHQPVDPLDRARQPDGRAALRPLWAQAHRAVSLALFVLGSAAGIVAKSLDMLVVARVLQASAAAPRCRSCGRRSSTTSARRRRPPRSPPPRPRS